MLTKNYVFQTCIVAAGFQSDAPNCGSQTHPKYAAALPIIRAEITGAASDILISNLNYNDY